MHRVNAVDEWSTILPEVFPFGTALTLFDSHLYRFFLGTWWTRMYMPSTI